MSTVNGGWRGPNIVKDGLVLYLDAGSPNSFYSPTAGTTWKDISGLSNNGTLTNGPTYDSANGGSIVLDGSNDYVEMVRSTSYDFNQTNSFTIAGWFYITSTTTNTPYFGKWGNNSSSNGSYLLWTRGLSGNRLAFSVASGSVTAASTPIITYNFNQWNYFVGVYIAGTRLELYLNNGSANTTNYTGNINNTTNVNLRISKADYAGDTFNGRVGLAQVYNRALSASEINQNFQSTRARFGI